MMRDCTAVLAQDDVVVLQAMVFGLYTYITVQVNRKIATVQFTGFDEFTSAIVRIVACHGNNHQPMNPLT